MLNSVKVCRFQDQTEQDATEIHDLFMSIPYDNSKNPKLPKMLELPNPLLLTQLQLNQHIAKCFRKFFDLYLTSLITYHLHISRPVRNFQCACHNGMQCSSQERQAGHQLLEKRKVRIGGRLIREKVHPERDKQNNNETRSRQTADT